MSLQLKSEFIFVRLLGPVIIALIFIVACSLLSEPKRRRLSAIILAGAGAAYLSGGLLGWEFAFCTLLTWVAYRGLEDYRFIGVGWLLHTAWDVVHHLYGNPIVPFAPLSSAGCAVCDVVLAIWYFKGAPAIITWLRPSNHRAAGN